MHTSRRPTTQYGDLLDYGGLWTWVAKNSHLSKTGQLFKTLTLW